MEAMDIKELRAKCESLDIKYGPKDGKDTLIDAIVEFFQKRRTSVDGSPDDCFGKPDFFDPTDKQGCKKCMDYQLCSAQVSKVLGGKPLPKTEVKVIKRERGALKYSAKSSISVFDVDNPFESSKRKGKPKNDDVAMLFEVTEIVADSPPDTMGAFKVELEKYYDGVTEETVAELCSDLQYRGVIQVGH